MPHGRDNLCGGFTLVEMLISLALLAVLLASLAVAIHAATNSYSENNRLSALTETARGVLNRIAQDIRTSDAVTVTSTQITITPPDDGSGLQQLRYEVAGNCLNYYRKVNGATTSYVLIGPIAGATDEVSLAGATISSTAGVDWEGTACTKSVTITIVLENGDNDLTITSSASPRRNQLF
jgi:prepilin-type N-terminal cleavage/methylation domain-containing protein